MPTKMMKAVRLHEFGGPEVLRYEEAPIPELKPGEMLVRIHAVGINPPDLYLREGYKMLPPEWQPKVAFPLIPGTDISGVIEAVADGVTDFSAGDECTRWSASPAVLPAAARHMPSMSACRHWKLH
jgi:NADPH:quinone reductase-like Zn-dependent oxidoreductase